jgi:glycosidase
MKGSLMKKTDVRLRNSVIYQVFVRNHSEAGTFQAVIDDLDRIQRLGVDIVYLLPIHPIGEKNRKGTLGSPYSIQDYRKISPDLGTMEDFKRLIAETHRRKMKLIIDVVYNHTSRDSFLLQTHPEWFYKNANGEFANRVGEWWDVTDFDYTKDKALWIELADILKSYAQLGVDGFRCDVASLVPVAFWLYARKVVAKVNRKVIWLSESVHGGFCKYIRDCGFEAASEAEIYEAFDMAYDYDAYPYFEDYLHGKRPLREYLESLKRQDEIYPANYVKMKYADNHDTERLAKLVQNDPAKFKNWLSFLFFQKGAMMLYAGVEYASDVRPDLFEKDVFVRHDDVSLFVQKLAKLKKKPVFSQGIYDVKIPSIDGIAYVVYRLEGEEWHGVFNVGGVKGKLNVDLPDGAYANLLSRSRVKVADSRIALSDEPIIVRMLKSKEAA